MLLALDMGNTNIKIGVFKGDKLLMESRLATNYNKTEDQYAIQLLDILRLYGVDNKGFEGAVMSSVVPPLTNTISRAIEKVTGVTPMSVGPGIKTGIDIRIDNPAQLGADLLVGAVAAVAQYGAPCIIWDLGTATTVSVVDDERHFRGGAIMAGVGVSIEALVSRASQLPKISLEALRYVVGTNTIASMQSGAVYGTASMIDGMSDRITEELGCEAAVVITGGLGREIASCCRCKVIYDDNLLLNGLRIVYNKNKK